MLYTPYTGFPPFAAIPDANATACSSAIPTSTNCFPASALLLALNPITVGVPELIATSAGSFFIFLSRYSPVRSEYASSSSGLSILIFPVTGSKGAL